MLNVWRHNADAMFLAIFEVFRMHVFYNVLERAHQGELKPETNFVDITKIEWDMVFLNLNNNIANCEFPPWEKSPISTRNSVPANPAVLHMWCKGWP